VTSPAPRPLGTILFVAVAHVAAVIGFAALAWLAGSVYLATVQANIDGTETAWIADATLLGVGCIAASFAGILMAADLARWHRPGVAHRLTRLDLIYTAVAATTFVALVGEAGDGYVPLLRLLVGLVALGSGVGLVALRFALADAA
jgi:hypothetical protein